MTNLLLFTLRQNTPLVHFHAEQPGATVRPSELKPKLDRYLMERATQQTGDAAATAYQQQHPLHCVGGTRADRIALDYQVRVITRPEDYLEEVQLGVRQNRGKWVTDEFPTLLSNMGGKPQRDELKNLSMYDRIQVEIFSLHTDLVEKIKQEFGRFIMHHNFGNRQSKGFGSFTLVDEKGKDKRWKLDYKFTVEVGGRDLRQEQQFLFERIDLFYRTLRAGINLPHRRFYFKSLAARFAQERLEAGTWDKRVIKEKYVNNREPRVKVDVKDYFGLSTVEAWKDQRMTITKDAGVVERFQSPLFFKPFRHREGGKYTIYLRIDPIPNAFRQATIKVEKDGRGNLELTPAPDFNFIDFFNYAFTEVDLHQHLSDYDRDGSNYAGNRIFTQQILPIYESIRNNL